MTPRFRRICSIILAACAVRSAFAAAPPSAEQKPPAAQASDRGDTTMRTMRHPFAVVAPTAPPRTN
jgi:hypothetical protein